MSLARCLMIQGTASGVGKSLLTAGIGRVLYRRGLRVVPFKAQNMALNAAVTADGGEVGRAQALQALACGVDVTRDMNPILLKPEGDSVAQVIVGGDVWARMDATAYHAAKPSLWPIVTESLDRLRADADVVVIEGAGSPAEVNLRERDIVNMRVAAYAGAPVLLVGDIDRGGVFASLLGTLSLLRPAERRLVRALIVNNFRGDLALFTDGARFLERRSRLPLLGVVPHVDGLRLAQEDSLGLPAMRSSPADRRGIDVAVVSLPRISNFDDCDPLLRERNVGVRLVEYGRDLGVPHLVVLPGSKATRADLAVMRARGLDVAVRAARTAGSAILGICGGFQLLGTRLNDPQGLDGGAPGSSRALGLLETATRMGAHKQVRRVEGTVQAAPGLVAQAAGMRVHGYEIHAGRTPAVPGAPFLVRESGADGATWPDGARSDDGWVVGTHLHGLMEGTRFRRALLGAVSERMGGHWRPGRAPAGPEAELDRLADAVEAALDVDRLLAIIAAGAV